MLIDPKTFERFNMILTGVVVPRPIAFVSTMSTDGVVNLAPFSFFNAMAYNPPHADFLVVAARPRLAGQTQGTP